MAEMMARMLIDLNRRIKGGFFLIGSTPERLLPGNRACPFAEKVIGPPSLCMMSSNVFGRLAADSLGYAREVLEQTIGKGDPS